jgi:hypothetical protein
LPRGIRVTVSLSTGKSKKINMARHYQKPERERKRDIFTKKIQIKKYIQQKEKNSLKRLPIRKTFSFSPGNENPHS